MSFRLKSKKTDILWPINILKYCLPLFFITFFGQTFFLIISLFECKNGKRYYDQNVFCKNKWFYGLLPFSIISLIIQLFISFLTVSMYYKPDYINNKTDSVLIKRNSFPDITFLFCKIIIILIFILDRQYESEHWGILFFISILTGFNAYFNIFIQNYSNITIRRFNNALSLSLFWSFDTLLIQKIIQNFHFNGGLYLFFFGIILIILFCFFYNDNYTDFLIINFSNINSSTNCLNYIKYYLKMIEAKDISRDSLLIFNSFISKAEERCNNKKCVLNKYLESLSKGIDSKFLLLQYAEKLFKIAISKFPEDIYLKINYVIFLNTKINKKKEAKTELFLIKPKFFSFNDNYNLYLCDKYLEEYFTIINAKNKEKMETFNMIQALEYRNYMNEFKLLLIKSSTLYYDFWSSLYSSHIQGTEDLDQLNDIGNQLYKSVEKIEKLFLKLNEIKNNDYEVIKLYESFIKNILNSKEKSKKYHDISIDLSNYNKINYKEADYTNCDLEILKESDENNYLIISADEENKGIILNMSLGACSIFGYHKNELIGKKMDILIPDIFKNMHEKTFNDVTEKLKTQFYDNLVNNLVYKPEYTAAYVHAKNKSKYLVPLYLKTYLVQTEESELVYIVEINRNYNYIGELNENFNKNDNNNENICCILVDNNLKIKAFTSNCVDILKLNSNIINSNYDISYFIKQLNDDYQATTYTLTTNKDYLDFEISDITNEDNVFLKLNDNNSNKNINSIINKSIENKLKNKKKLIKSKFSCPRRITWKIESNDKASILYSEKMKNKTLSLLSQNDSQNINDKYEKHYIMLVREAFILNKPIGFYFYFKKAKNLESKNKTLKLIRKSRNKKNSLFKNINIEEILHYSKPEGDSSKIINLKTNYAHKNTMHIPEHFNEQKKNINVMFDLENTNINKFEDENNINNKFIPQSNFNFIFDINTMSFKPLNDIKPPFELIENLKNEALNKRNIVQESIKQKKTLSISNSNSQNSSSRYNYSSDYYSSSYLYSYDMNSSNFRSDIRKEEITTRNNFVNKNNNKNNNINELYYKVNIRNIKFIIYDFNREKFVELIKEEKDKKSQMDYIIESFKLNRNMYINEDDNYPNYSNLNYNKEKTVKNIKTDKQTKVINQNQIQNITKHEKEKDFEKEIIDSLARKDEQKAIIDLYISVIICTCLFLLMNIMEILYITTSYTKLKNNLKLLIDSINLKYYNNFDIYALRELLLCYAFFNNISLGDNNYYNFPTKNEVLYFIEVSNLSNYTFYNTHSLVESIFGSELTLTKNTSYVINEMPYYTETLINNTNIKKMNTTLSISIIYIYSFFCNILTNEIGRNIFSSESYNFIHNAMNSLGKAILILNELFLFELKKRESGIIKNIIFITIINLIIYIVIYFINNKRYYKVINKKMSYLTVFYEIKLPIIKSSIKKCEIFINKINKEDIKFERIGSIESFNSYSSNSKNNNLSLNNEEMKNINNYNKEDNNNEKKIETEQKYTYVQNLFIIALLLSFLYLCFIFIYYFFLIRNFLVIAEYIKHMQNYHNNIIELFNSYREFLFDENSIIFGMPSYEYLIYKEKEFYSTNTEDILFLNTKYQKITNNINELNETELCTLYKNNSFYNKEECEDYMGGKEGIINLGFDTLVKYFIGELGMKRNYIKKLINNKILVGNLSDLNDMELWTDDYLGLKYNKTLIFRMNLFNMEDIHKKLNLIFINIISQYINKERNITLNSIINFVNNKEKVYVILIVSHCTIIVAIILLYCFPKIKKMNVEIYKTKNMLSIIPIKILASLPNIKQLLNISKKSYL